MRTNGCMPLNYKKNWFPFLMGVWLGLALFLALYVKESGLGRRDAADEPLAPIEQFAEVVIRIRERYFEPVDEAALVENAIRSLLADLDEHARFLDEDGYANALVSSSSRYSGVGLDVTVHDGRLTVLAPLKDTPAERAGILPHDVVVAVNDVPVRPENTEDSISRMRGEAGTAVTLDVVRAGEEDPLRFALTRAEVRMTTVHADYLGDGFGYMRLSSFVNGMDEELREAAARMLAEHELQALVLDLRDNPGGSLDAAIEVADAFLDEGLIVSGRGRTSDARFAYDATPGDVIDDRKLIVLVDGRSASAAEIVAAALQDNRRARLVGERTYGKGSVQSLIPLVDGGALKLTTSEYFTPGGRSIDGAGVEPDLVVEGDRRYRGSGSDVAAEDDRQLVEALAAAGFNPPRQSVESM